MSINVGTSRTLGLYNDVTKAGLESSHNVSIDDWHELSVVLFGPDDARQVAVLLDSILIPELSGPIDLGGTPLGGIQLGDSTGDRVYDVRYSTFSVAPAPDEVASGTPASERPSPVDATPGTGVDATPSAISGRLEARVNYLQVDDTDLFASRGTIPP
jgi:hypothetical protein